MTVLFFLPYGCSKLKLPKLCGFIQMLLLKKFSESFTFHHDCRDNGVVVSVESKFSYTGALYGLYDFFTCRIEPKNETRFSLFFPYAFYSKNCTDSFSQKVITLVWYFKWS